MDGAPPTGPAARTWVDGVEVDASTDEWDRRVAGFLGFGYRVVLPSGPAREAAVEHARTQASRLAGLLGADLDLTPWSRLGDATGPVELVGGWEHRFRQPPGACSTRLTPLPAAAPDHRVARAVELPWSVNEHSPTTGMPMLSSHGATASRRRLAPGEVGLMRNTAGVLVDTTAGVPLLLTAGGWSAPGEQSGAVWHHVPHRVRLGLGADDRSPTDDELVAVACLDPLGTVTWLTGLGACRGRASGEVVDELETRVAAALATGPGA